jgi:glutathione S-transferase
LLPLFGLPGCYVCNDNLKPQIEDLDPSLAKKDLLMITLLHAPMSRSGSIVWLLEELGVPYETKIVNIRRADGSGARAEENPHPHGKVPLVVDDGETVFETGAIALYLTDKYRKTRMGPAPGEPGRGDYLSWLAYRAGVMEPALLCRRLGVNHVYGAMGWGPAEEVEEVLNRHLASRTYFLGDEFGAADVIVGGAVNFMMMTKVMADTPALKAYAERITNRPAYQRMMQRDAQR